MEQKDLLGTDLQITEVVLEWLRQTARWARFLAVIGFVVVGLLLVVAFLLPEMLAVRNYGDLDVQQNFTATGVRINFIILAVLLFLPCLFLFKFATQMKHALMNRHQQSFEDSFQNLKSTFKFYGILTIVVMGLYALAFLVVILSLMTSQA